MKTKIYLRVFAAVTMLAAFSCAKEIEPEVTVVGTTEETNQVRTYSVTVHAEKGEPATKALNLTGNTLQASWEEGEVVDVYKGDDKIGTLTAQSTGTSTTLKGTITTTLAEGDDLTLKFCSPSYATQDGTLKYIAANCDYATAEVTVSSIDNNTGIITACKGVNGGGIINNSGCTLQITGGLITNCRSDAGGGAIVNHGTATISGCTFRGNIATTRGGAIWSDGTLTVQDCTFTGNEALANGGDGNNAAAIGSNLSGTEHQGSLNIDDGLMVHAGDNPGSTSLSKAGFRVSDCWYHRYARVESCDSHEYVDGKCKWCGHLE